MSVLANKTTKAMLGCLFAALGGTSAAFAQDPTIEQLMATPTASEIVERWKAVCVDHAGDAKAQQKTVKDTGLTWPYQAMIGKTGKKPFCLLVSSTKTGTTINDFSGPLGAAINQPPEIFKEDGGHLKADIILAGASFWVGVSTQGTEGNLVSTVVLGVK